MFPDFDIIEDSWDIEKTSTPTTAASQAEVTTGIVDDADISLLVSLGIGFSIILVVAVVCCIFTFCDCKLTGAQYSPQQNELNNTQTTELSVISPGRQSNIQMNETVFQTPPSKPEPEQKSPLLPIPPPPLPKPDFLQPNFGGTSSTNQKGKE